MRECHSATTPAAIKHPHSADEQTPYDNPTQFRQLIGVLQYLILTRPDISFTINKLCQAMHNPTKLHFQQLKRLLRYVHGTFDYGLQISPTTLDLHAYSDSDWAGDQANRKSTTA